MRFSWSMCWLIPFILIQPLFLSPIFAWNANGHMVVAKIAYEQLTPEAREKVDKLIGYLHQEYAEIKTFPQAAVWADKLRSQQLSVYTHWHYIDNPLVRDGGTPNSNMIDDDNAVWAIDKIRVFVSNEKANPYERARFLAFLVHIVGDIHQPLHTVSLVTPKFPNGDRGGNNYFVMYKNKHTNMHKIWDEGVGAFEHVYADDDEETHHSEFVTQVNAIVARYPRAYFAKQLDKPNVEQWVKEGMDIANRYVYVTPENQAVNTNYIQQGSVIAEQQAALAGYRLAGLLNQLFN